MKKELTAINECYHCKFKGNIPGDVVHISCSNPDPKMGGGIHGIRNGWFIYPIWFDPVWKQKRCENFEQK